MRRLRRKRRIRRVTGEVSLLRWASNEETVDLRLVVAGEAPDAAWIMPTPPRASVSLGSSAAFPALDQVIAPRTVRRGV